MLIKKVVVRDFVGLTAVSIAPKVPVVLVAGDNGAGKTSLYQAIKLALFDDLPRIDLKKQATDLVRGGAREGDIQVTIGRGDEVAEPYQISLPGRKRTGPAAIGSPILRLCLDPERLATMEPESRMNLIRVMSGVSMDKGTIVEKLKLRKVPDDIVSELSPLLTLGFERCVEHSKEQASQQRGAWRATTGEVYGAVKAKGWEPPTPPELPQPPMEYEEALERHQVAMGLVARLNAERAAYASDATARTNDKAMADRLDALRVRLSEYTAIAESAAPVPTALCPHCEALVELKPDGTLAVPGGGHSKPQHSAEAIADAKRKVEACKREITQAEAARDRLAAGRVALPNPTEVEVQEAVEAENLAADAMRTLNTQREAYQAAVRAAQEREAVIAKARAAHERAEGWETAVAALEPNGIPADLMRQAMTPFRAALKTVCNSEYVRDWPTPDLADDGTITGWGRPLALLSESEQYRVLMLLVAAIAHQTGVGIVAMDRWDVLSPARRGEAMGWALDMTEFGELAQVWFFATMKAKVAGGGGMEVHWLEHGVEA